MRRATPRGFAPWGVQFGKASHAQDSQLGYRAFLLRQAFPSWFPLIVYTITTRQTSDHRGSYCDHGEAEE